MKSPTKPRRARGTMVMREITLIRKHKCPQCGKEMDTGETALAWRNTKLSRNSAIYCGRDCFDEAQLKRHGLLEERTSFKRHPNFDNHSIS